MYLSDKKNGIDQEDHEELEVLLESFSKQVEEIVNEAETIEVGPFARSERTLSNSYSYLEQCSIDSGNSGVDPGFQP